MQKTKQKKHVMHAHVTTGPISERTRKIIDSNTVLAIASLLTFISTDK